METRRDEALVVRLTEYSETSQIATLFTALNGLVRLIAKGARRSTKTRFAAGLDLLELGDVMFVPPRGDAQLGTLMEWTQRDAFSGLRREALRLYGAMYAAELVTRMTEENDPHPRLYAGLVEAGRTLSGTAPAAPAIVAFQERLLHEVGYAPDLHNCVGCKHHPADRQRVYFSAGGGGIVCRDCEMHVVEKRRVPAGLLASPPSEGNAAEWFKLYDYYLTYLAGQRFRTAETVARLISQAAASKAGG